MKLPKPRIAIHRIVLMTAMLAVGALGVAYTLASYASTPFVAVEPDQGNMTAPAETIADAGASKGSAVVFKSDIVAPPSPTPPPPNEFPTAETTGYSAYYAHDLGRKLQKTDLKKVGSVSSTRDGEVIERLWVTGRIKILHNNVTVRAVYLEQNGLYGVTWDSTKRPTGTTVEYCELNGMSSTTIGLYLGNVVVSHCNIYGYRGGGQLLRGTAERPTKVQHSYVHDLYYSTGSHNTSLSTHGQSYIDFHHNNLDDGSSAALSLYCDPNTAPCHNINVTNNLFNVTRANYCTIHAGDNSASTNIKYINNTFGTKYHPKCGSSGPVANRSSGPGYEWTGNVYDTGIVIP